MTREQDLQSMIRNAGQYITPSDQLRAATVENAKQIGSDHKAQKRFTFIAIACGLLMMALAPIAYQLSQLRLPTQPNVDGIQAVTQGKSLKGKTIRGSSDPAWSMVDVFSDMRRVQTDPDKRLMD